MFRAKRNAPKQRPQQMGRKPAALSASQSRARPRRRRRIFATSHKTKSTTVAAKNTHTYTQTHTHTKGIGRKVAKANPPHQRQQSTTRSPPQFSHRRLRRLCRRRSLRTHTHTHTHEPLCGGRCRKKKQKCVQTERKSPAFYDFVSFFIFGRSWKKKQIA